jgi:hypothetical protein
MAMSSTTTVDDLEPREPVDAPGASSRPLPGDHARAPIYVFVVVEVIALGVFWWLGRDQWFFLDEWDYLVTRDGGSIADLFTSHNEHWTTIPIVLYRILWNVFGLRTYLPYQLMTLVAHLAVAWLVFLLIRRAGVNPWIATAGATLFALFGAGAQNVIWAFQITFLGAIAFGLLQLALAYHDGPVERRDGYALIAGLLALMFSGVALTILGVVGLTMWLRRGWKVAVLQTLPLVIVYGTWFVFYGRDSGNGAPRSTPSEVLRFAWEGLKGTYRELGNLPGLGIVLVAVLLVGLVVFVVERGPRRALYDAALPLSMLAGSVVFMLTAGLTRVNLVGPSFGSTSRYLYVVAALSVPALALALDTLARRWHVIFPIALVLLLAPVPGSIIDEHQHPNRNLVGDKSVVVLTEMEGLDGVPPETIVAAQSGRAQLTLEWLRNAAAEGELPTLTPEERSVAEVNWRLRLALRQTLQPATGACTPIGKGADLTLAPDERIGIVDGPVQVLSREPGGAPFNLVTFHPAFGETLVVEVPGVDVRIQSTDPTKPASICR